MKITAAVVEHKGGKFHMRDDIELCKLGATDVRVHMVASGICHTDEALRRGDDSVGYPVILGHEGAGIVEKVGSAVTNFKPGDHVVMSFYGCGRCDNCLKGRPTQCRHFNENNLSGLRPGGKAQFTEAGHPVYDLFDQSSFTTTCVVRERNCVKVPKDLDLRKLGPLGCGYVTGSGTVLNALKPRPGQNIAVFGTGAVGLAAMMAGKISGCLHVIAVDIVPERLQLASELGATETVNSKENDPVEAIKQITDGKGVDYVVDTTGLPGVIKSGIDSLAPGGTCAAIAVSAHKVEVAPWNELCEGDRKLIGVMMGDSIPQIDIPRLIEFYRRGWFDFDKTERFYDFEDINEADAASVSGEVIKPVLIIDKDYQPGD